MYKIASALIKVGGATSEIVSILNPLNLAAAPFGAVAAAFTPTRSSREQAIAEDDLFKNLLIPGYGVHNLYKRLGRAKADFQPGYAQDRGTDSLYNPQGDKPMIGDVNSQVASGILLGNVHNALNFADPMLGGVVGPVVGGMNLLGATAAALTPTRTPKEMIDRNNDSEGKFLNLIPGVSAYNQFKTIGRSIKDYEELNRKMKENGEI